MVTHVHPTAMVSPGAELDAGVEIGPYSVLGPAVKVGARTKIGAHVVIEGVTEIGEDNLIVGQASLGAPPQDLSYRSEPTRLEIGNRNTIREFVTINRGTIKGGGVTRIGSDCLLMACCHVAHDCELRDGIIIGNNTLLAGHVLVEERANISGGAAAHHFVTIGAYCYVGGMTRMVQDVPPFMILEGHPSRVRGVNVIGLRRGGFEEGEVDALREAYRRIFRTSKARRLVLDEMRGEPSSSLLVGRLLQSLDDTLTGAKGRYRETLRGQFAKDGAALILQETPDPMSAPLRVGVAGVGHLGAIHAKIYAEHPDAELVCICDTNTERAGELAAELGCDLVDDPAGLPRDLDAVSVAVPTAAHAAVSVPLLERGQALLIEKPLASNVAEADAILAAAERGGATLAVGHVERFQPGLRKVREWNVQPRFIECHRLAPFSFRSMDVGVVHDLMIHDLDLVLDLVGSEVESLDAAGGAILTDHADVASVRIVFANGARANVTASRASMTPMRRFRMFSSGGYVSLDFTKNYGLVIRKGPEWETGRQALKDFDPMMLAMKKDWIQTRVLKIDELELGGEQRPLQAELDSFLTSVRNGTEPEVTGLDGRRALALADRIAGDIRAQRW